MVIKELKRSIEIPEGVEVNLEGSLIRVEGPKGKNQRELVYPKIIISKEDNKINLITKDATKREKKLINTFEAHIKNLIKGVIEGFTYKLKVCSEHFPMNISIEGKELLIKNFLGEKIPRKAKIVEGVNVKLEGDVLVVEGLDKEKTGQTAANIEQATRITKRDRHRFMDGIWIFKKGDREIK